jgi:hypothetical protein
MRCSSALLIRHLDHELFLAGSLGHQVKHRAIYVRLFEGLRARHCLFLESLLLLKAKAQLSTIRGYVFLHLQMTQVIYPSWYFLAVQLILYDRRRSKSG